MLEEKQREENKVEKELVVSIVDRDITMTNRTQIS